jgi:chromosome segregation ATPase
MRMRLWMKAFFFVPALCLAGLSAAAQQTGDPVADAARKAREAKKDTTKPKKVYTDDDIKTSAPEKAAPSGATNDASGKAAGAPGQATGASGKAGEEPKEDPNSESAWRKRFQTQRDKIAKAEKELDILTRELEKAQVEYYPDPQKAMQQQNTRADINTINGKIDAKKQELDQLKKGLDDLEDQLRKSGGDPGWAR